MELEDVRSQLLREHCKVHEKETFINNELQKLKGEQSKLTEDIQDFTTIREAYEQYMKQRSEQISKTRKALYEKFNEMDQELKDKEQKLRKYDNELRQREKVLTDLILNN